MGSELDATKISFDITEAFLLVEGTDRHQDEPPPVVRAAGDVHASRTASCACGGRFRVQGPARARARLPITRWAFSGPK